VLLLFLVTIVPGSADGATPTEIPVYYLMQAQDDYYAAVRGYAGLQLKQPRRPLDGVKSGLREARVLGRSANIKFKLEVIVGEDRDDIAARIPLDATGDSIVFIVADLPKEDLLYLSKQYIDKPVLIFNARHRDNDLRGPACARNLFHTLPSYSMLYDALAQYLKKKRWNKVLVLTGKEPQDLKLSEAFKGSAKKLGLKIVDSKSFAVSNNPQDRSENNIPILTSGPDHDVVFIADSFGEFSRYLPYQTARPNLVVGSEGLVAAAWHWTWERHGAPQLNQRFDKVAEKPHMSPQQWAGWAAVKALVTATVKTGSTDFKAVSGFLRSAELTLDLYKGAPGNFRSWNNQLRQPILLHTHNAVLQRAPIDGFIHRTNNLDSLGQDAPESKCEL